MCRIASHVQTFFYAEYLVSKGLNAIKRTIVPAGDQRGKTTYEINMKHKTIKQTTAMGRARNCL